jgi:hypothetical protein
MSSQVWKNASSYRKILLATSSLFLVGIFLIGARSVVFSAPYLPLAIAGGLVFYLRAFSKAGDILLWLLLSVLFGLAVNIPRNGDWILVGSAVLALPGIAGLLLLALRCVWSDGKERVTAYGFLAPAFSMVLFVFSAQRVLGLANLLYPKTFDLYLFAADGAFRWQPNYALCRAMIHFPIFGGVVKLVYVSLPFIMALIYAMRIPKDAKRPSWDMVTLFLLAGVVGSVLYNVLPGTGPIYAFRDFFPWQSLPHESLQRLRLERIFVPADVPRNAIPSLHAAWVILLWWNSRRLSLLMRVFTGAYLVLTVISTLATGEHYLVDIVAGVPYALCMQAIVSPERRALELAQRVRISLIGLGLTLMWMLLIRFDTKWLLISPIIPWTLLAFTVGSVVFLNGKLTHGDVASNVVAEVGSVRGGALAGNAPETACNPPTL